MYTPRHFGMEAIADCHALIRENSFALLVTVDADGLPVASHLPLVLDPGRGAQGTLLGHMARANGQWQAFASRRPALAVFQGPHAYVSPRWYAVSPSVPTWNYTAVHAHGVPAVQPDPAVVRAYLSRLTEIHEAGAAEPWRLDSIDGGYVEGMMRGIVAFEMPIDRLEGKAKLSQNRSAADRAGAVAGLRQADDAASAAVAEAMERLQR